MAKLYAIGLGPGPLDMVAPRSIEILKSCDAVFTFASELTHVNKMTEDFIGPDRLHRRHPTARDWGKMDGDPVFAATAEEIKELVTAGSNVGVVFAGDASLFSPFAYLAPELRSRSVDFEIVPAISFINALPGGTKDVLAEEAGGLLIKHFATKEELLRGLEVSPTIVLYSVSREIAEVVHDLAAQGYLASAQMIRVHPDGHGSVTADLTLPNFEYKPKFGKTCVVTRNSDHPHFRLDAEAPEAVTPAHQRMHVETLTYQVVEGVELKATVFRPEGAAPQGPAPVLALFHGGAWRQGSRSQFFSYGNILAKLGVGVVTFSYRILLEHGTEPRASVADATTAVEWLRDNLDRFGFDGTKIFLGGASAGGHIATWGLLNLAAKLDTVPADLAAGLVLMNPVTDTSENGFGHDRIPGDVSELNLNLHLRRDMPPAVVFHGLADRLVPFENSCEFERRMKELGNECRLVLYADRPHGFFNYRHGQDSSDFFAVLREVLHFLIEREAIGRVALPTFEAIYAHERANVLQHPHADPVVISHLKRIETALRDTKKDIGALQSPPAAVKMKPATKPKPPATPPAAPQAPAPAPKAKAPAPQPIAPNSAAMTLLKRFVPMRVKKAARVLLFDR